MCVHTMIELNVVTCHIFLLRHILIKNLALGPSYEECNMEKQA